MAGGGREAGLPHEGRPPARVSRGRASLLAGAGIRGSRPRAGGLQAQAFGTGGAAPRQSDVSRQLLALPDYTQLDAIARLLVAVQVAGQLVDAGERLAVHRRDDIAAGGNGRALLGIDLSHGG